MVRPPLTTEHYATFVRRTDLGKKKPHERADIALYGLVGEIGSLVAAIKKRLLTGGRRNWSVANDEIVEELGDALWYCFALGEARGIGSGFVARDLLLLQEEVGGTGERSATIRQILGDRAAIFLERGPALLPQIEQGSATLAQFQEVAFLTSRTRDDELVEVCLAVLQQLAGELMRCKLPASERRLNSVLEDRPLDLILAEVLWHLSALASLYSLDLGEVADRNMVKLERRFGRGTPAALPDEGMESHEQFPRVMEILFVPVGDRRSRMYAGGRRLGDDLTDNAYEEDGYRFHDVMHLALAAKLGWSPVLRKLLGRKRKSNPRLDQVEDGARAQIVEEAVINAIYAEGVRLASLQVPQGSQGPTRLFGDASDISFTFLKRIETLVSGLEVERSSYWEWEDAITEGFGIFNRLRNGGGRGTVTINLNERSISFAPGVLLDLQGSLAALGTARTAVADLEDLPELTSAEKEIAAQTGASSVYAARAAVMGALALSAYEQHEIEIVGWLDGLMDVQVSGRAQAVIWDRKIVSFRASAVQTDEGALVTVTAISDG